ncbi:MAG: nitroreductase [Dehalococcoidia bacterium]|nr:nitroreductase [Dehalococcoidia bacterium]
MELLEGIETRKSYRAFKPTPVTRETIEKILRVAGRSPSYTNTQPWEVAVVNGQKKAELGAILHRLAESGTPGNPDMPRPGEWPPELDKRGKEHGARRYEAMGVARDDRERRRELSLANYDFYGAPCVLLIFIESSLTSWSIYDAGLFSQSLILAAHGLGLGTCLQASLGNYPDAVRSLLGIPANKRLVLGISLGYPDNEALINQYRSNRAELSEWVRWVG